MKEICQVNQAASPAILTTTKNSIIRGITLYIKQLIKIVKMLTLIKSNGGLCQMKILTTNTNVHSVHRTILKYRYRSK